MGDGDDEEVHREEVHHEEVHREEVYREEVHREEEVHVVCVLCLRRNSIINEML